MYLGFTGATGKSFELHDVHSWSFAGTELIAQSPSVSPSPGVSLSHPPATRSSASKSMMVLVVTLGISFVIGAASFLILLRYYNYKKKRIVLPVGKSIKDASIDPSAFILTADFLYGPRKFTYKELSMATNHFSQKQELGRGGFGSVYKGIVPGDGTMIAVKRTSKTSSQGEREFVAEVSIIGRLRHRNLVPLLGWCHGKGDLLLVYEFMPNGSLDKLLFGSKGEFLDWPRRYKIVCGLAAALLYLHEEWEDQVVHRDVKASNVMLDANFTARLGDFGLARLIEHNKNAETTLAAGTLGYLAPEVSQTGKATTKSDVYSFGAVALEVACGRRPIDRTLPAEETILLEWVWSLQARGRITDAADARLEASSIVSSELQCLLQLGLACSHPDPEARPTIRQVLQILKGDAALPAIPSSKPVPNYYHFSFQDLFVEMAHDTTPTDASAAATGMESISFTDSETANSIDSDTPARVPEAGTALLR
ncbi:hypothetical protein O6H91_04G126500 [Diphasiastrum complanatum]|nr:hypothetical protein O6H91_04G126500 [Diphasiastrum complanatum]